MRYLVTGGAGFIGSHVALSLLEHGHDITVFDDLSTGHRAAIPSGAAFHYGDLLDTENLNALLATGRWDGVLHFAGLSLVGASMLAPYHYLRQNMLTSLNLIEACVRHHVPRFIFSSTAALFSSNEAEPLLETAPIQPGSPYGESKYLIERTLHWAEKVHGLRYGCLRYFNAAGADPLGRLGEDHQPETHLIPLAIDAALGRRSPLQLFGSDYPTPDGTCIRDYIHVSDLAEAHILTLTRLSQGSVTYNLGMGKGVSNLSILKAVEHVTGRPLPWEYAPRRAGDPTSLVTSSALIRTELGWQPRYQDIESIIDTAYRWRLAHPTGYKSMRHTP